MWLAQRLEGLIQALFADKLVEDDRSPIAIFSIPGHEGEYALYPPKLLFYHQLLAVR